MEALADRFEHSPERGEVLASEPVKEVLRDAAKVSRCGAAKSRVAEIGEGRPLAATIVLAHDTLDEPADNEPVDESRGAGTRQQQRIGELAHAKAATGCGRELDEHVVVGEGQVLLGCQLAFQLTDDAGVRAQERAPGLESRIGSRRMRRHGIA